MSPSNDFVALIRQVRAGDEEAVRELLRQYEDPLRVWIRPRLEAARLRSVLDSVDICQSVFANFFSRAAAGQFELTNPKQLLWLLRTMARNNLLNKVKHHHNELLHLKPVYDLVVATLADRQPDPAQAFTRKELLEQARQLFSEEELWLVDRRYLGHSWSEMAGECGRSPEALRNSWPGPSTAWPASWDLRSSPPSKSGRKKWGQDL
jgi:DNA-directed RNA polymerase specialized sigma24 family protein